MSDTPTTQGPDPNVAGPAAPDPWKSFRGVMAGTLILEAIVVLLALPVVGSVGGGLTPWSMGYLIGFAVLLVLLAGVQGRPGAIRGAPVVGRVAWAIRNAGRAVSGCQATRAQSR